MKSTKLKNQHYSYLKMVLRVLTLGISIWALIVAYQAKNTAEWVEKVQDNVIEEVLFKR
jgi:hypothetical protein